MKVLFDTEVSYGWAGDGRINYHKHGVLADTTLHFICTLIPDK